MLLTLLLILIVTANAEECKQRDYGNGGHVCVCTSTFCDTLPKPEPPVPPSYLIYTSNKAGLRFRSSSGTFSNNNEISDTQISVNSNEKYQEVLGWGGAFTDATGINIKSLNEGAQERLLESYFSDHGIEYSLCRVPIGGTDFSMHGYSYDDGEQDPELRNFALADEDFRYKIPIIKKAQNLSPKLRFFASAWTAPKWMKTNNEYSGWLGFLRENMHQSWAEYFLKFLDKYQEQGITFWGITTGNEPSLAMVPSKINSIAWTPSIMGNWIRNHLGPTIRNSTHSKIKIMMLDDQRFFLPWVPNIVLKNKTTRNFVDGIAVHWYYDKTFPPSLLKETHENFPEKFLLATEACHGDKPLQKHVSLGSWDRGESYADDIIQDVQNWVSGWVDWNMVLDMNGGPTYIKNFVDSPIIVNSTAGEFYKQPMFYALGHFSKFVPPDSVRIGSSSSSEQVSVAAFRRADNGTAVVILNKGKETRASLVDNVRGSTVVELSEKSITSVLYW